MSITLFWHINIMLLIVRRYAWDWLAILLLMVILVITEKLKPFEKSIYHEDDSVRLHNHRAQSLNLEDKALVFCHTRLCQEMRMLQFATRMGITRLHLALVTRLAASSDSLCKCMILTSLLMCHVTTKLQLEHVPCTMGSPAMMMNCPTSWCPAGNLAIQLPLAHKEHSASMGSPNTVHLRSGKRLRCVVPDLEAWQMGDAQSYSGTDGQRVCMRSHHQHGQDHSMPFPSSAASYAATPLTTYCVLSAWQHKNKSATFKNGCLVWLMRISWSPLLQ